MENCSQPLGLVLSDQLGVIGGGARNQASVGGPVDAPPSRPVMMPRLDMRWVPLSERAPEPEVFVLCWDGKRCFIDWWGSLRDNGNGATHWYAFYQPPGSSSMYDGRRA